MAVNDEHKHESDGRENPEACASCQPTKFRLERLDAWHSAKNALFEENRWEDSEPVCPRDVLGLALFLTGSDLSNTNL